MLKLVGSAEAWNRPITRAVVVERLARRYLAEGKPDGFAACARLLGLAPTPAERERLIRAMEQQMEGLHLDKAPEALAAALEPLLEEEQPSSALVRLSLRLGLEAAYPLAAARAADARLPAAERADFIRTLGELKRPASLAALLALLGEQGAGAGPRRGPAGPPAVRVARGRRRRHRRSTRRCRPPSGTRRGTCWSAGRPGPPRCSPPWRRAAVPAKDFSLDQVRRIVLHKDAALTARAEKLWGQVRPATSREKQGRIMAVSQILAQGDGRPGPGQAARRQALPELPPALRRGGEDRPRPDGRGPQEPGRAAAERRRPQRGHPRGLSAVRRGHRRTAASSPACWPRTAADKVTVLDAKGVRTTLRRKRGRVDDARGHVADAGGDPGHALRPGAARPLRLPALRAGQSVEAGGAVIEKGFFARWPCVAC